MAIDARILRPEFALQTRVPDVSKAINIFENALMNSQTRDIRGKQEQRASDLAPFQLEKAQQGIDINQQSLDQNRNKQRLLNLHETGQRIKPFLDSGDVQGAQNFLLDNMSQIQTRIEAGENLDVTESMDTLRKLQSGDVQGVLGDIAAIRGLVGGGSEVSLGQREFDNNVAAVEADPKLKTARGRAASIALGMTARAGSSAQERIAGDEDLTQQVADSKAKIRQAEKFGELTASSRSKAIDKGFDQISKIDLGLSNIDDAIQAVTDGAGTGFIEKNFPSIKAASVLLDNIQGRMALDVIGSVTFGALSQGELDLAKMIALPTGLKGPELIKHLQDKKVAQQKLRNYYGEQIEFLDQGGSVAGFLRSKERESSNSAPTQPDQPQVSDGQTATGPNGEKAVFTNGQWVVQ